MTMRRTAAFVLLLVVLIGCSADAPPPADLVLLGGRVVTLDPARPEATAVAARGDRIVAIGDEERVRRLVGPDTHVVELVDELVIPGLIDAHGHFLGLGLSQMQLDLTSAASWNELVESVAAAAAEAPAGSWVVGRGWHQEKWAVAAEPSVEGLPVHDELSRSVPDHPVLLVHASGHAAMVNRRALDMAGITADTPDPPGGEIVRRADGEPTGVLRETAEELVATLAAERTDPAAIRRRVELAGAECLRHGVTSFQDAGTSLGELETLRAMAEEGALPIRLWVMLDDDTETLRTALPRVIVRGAGRNHLTVGGIKRWVDGALGSHGAWLLAPYDDLPTSTGLNIVTADELRAAALLAAEHRLQLCSHAIGDRANRVTLDVYESVLTGLSDGDDRRWRVEHAQHLHPDDIPRFARLGVVASMQPVHCTSDGPWVVPRLGERRAREGAYMWRGLLDSGALLASGTDVPVEPVDPIATFHAAVTRKMADGAPFHAGQAMTRDEALRSMTLDAARAAFEEDLKGSLDVGKLADLTVLSADLLEVPEDEIQDVEVVYTIVGGEVRYAAR